MIMVRVTYHDDDKKWDVVEHLLLNGADPDVKEDKVSTVQR